MSIGMTCYERDEQLCTDRICLVLGRCALLPERLIVDDPEAIDPDPEKTRAAVWRWFNEEKAK